MQRFTITKNATSQIIPVSIYDSSSTTGAKLAGLVFNTAGLTAYYNRMGAAGAATAITLVTAGSADDSAYANCTIVLEDVATATQKSIGMVLAYTGATKTVTLKEAPAFTIAATDKVYILAENSLKSTVANRQLDVTAAGAVNNVILTATTTTNTDMRGTDSAALASVVTEARLSELDAATAGKMANQVDIIQTDTTTDIPATITTLQSDTDNIQTRIPAALVSGRMDSNVSAINNVNQSAINLEKSASAIVTGAAIAGTLSTTQMTTDLAEATNDHYNGRIIIWTTGVLAGQATDITAYSGTSKMLTYTAVTEAPTAADTFVIV